MIEIGVIIKKSAPKNRFVHNVNIGVVVSYIVIPHWLTGYYGPGRSDMVKYSFQQ